MSRPLFTPCHRKARVTCARFLVLASILLFTACPYSGVAVGEPDASTLDRNLLGDWVFTEVEGHAPDPESGEPTRLSVTQISPAEYLLAVVGRDSVLVMRGHLTRLGGEIFLNVSDRGLTKLSESLAEIAQPSQPVEEPEYLVLRMRATGDELELRHVSDDIGTPANAAELRALLLSRMNDRAAYDEHPYRLRRAVR